MEGLVIGFAFTVLLSVIVGLPRSRTSSSSLRNFFVGDHAMSQKEVTNLLMASSMSLNGLFYHAWLGYKVGVYSLLVQVFWAGSFLILVIYRKRLVTLSQKDSLFGNIETHFGSGASILAVVAAILTFIVLIGWEISIASSFMMVAFDLGVVKAAAVAFLVVFVAVSYTFRGGIYGNAVANIVQNWMKILAFILIIIISVKFADTFASVIPSEQQDSINYFKLNPLDAAVGLGGIFALMCNLFFSILWQPADGSAWQVVASGADKAMRSEDQAKKTLLYSAFKILLFPGLAGTALGISLAGVPNLSDSEIFPTLYKTLNSLPHGIWYVGGLAVLLTAAMLSTIDGLLLAVSYAVSRDVIYKKQFDKFVSWDNDRPKTREDTRSERNILAMSKFFILIAGLLSLFVFFLVQSEVIGLFEIVYLAVIGQMALAPLALQMIRRGDLIDEGASHSRGWWGILLGLIVGYGFWSYGTFYTPMLFVSSWNWLGGLPWVIAAPPMAFITCALTTFFTSK